MTSATRQSVHADLLPPVPGNKAARHDVILQLISSGSVSSQEVLRQELAAMGIETTQATLSRDLLELRATKVRNQEGALVYAIPEDGEPLGQALSHARSKLARWCQDLLVAVDIAGQFLVVRTPVGAANLLGAAIDSARFEQILGTIAGDDTIMVICRDNADAQIARSDLLHLAEPGSETTSRQ